MNLLETIHSPADLRRLPRAQLKLLADELRECVLTNVARTGGHLSSNLGTVELTIALHCVFNTPHDRLVWDVGHQTYPHKILTGRRERMPTLRQLEGISGFPRRDESEYDSFGTAHSSTSISAALGMAVAARQKGEDRDAVAIIGDGAMTGGMAFEAEGARCAGLLSDPLKKAMGMLLTGRHVSAQEGSDLGFVTEVVPHAELKKAARSWASDILACSPMSVRATKQVVMRSLDTPALETAMHKLDYPAFVAMTGSEDTVEGPRAFAEKRKPDWKGR